MRIFALVFLFAVQLFSSQIFVKGGTTLYLESENHIASDSISLTKDEENIAKNTIYVSSGSQILISGSQKNYSIIKINDELAHPEKKEKDLAKAIHEKKQKALEQTTNPKVYPEVKKTKFYWPLEGSNNTFSVNSKHSQGAVFREHFKVENINFAKSFYVQFPHFSSNQKNITSNGSNEIEKMWYFCLSVRPPPFV